MDSLEYINCNLCKSNAYLYLNYEGGRRVVKCKKCGLIYRNPRYINISDRETESIRNYGDYVQMEQSVSFARGIIFKKILRQLTKRINNPGKSILDIGCGQGYFLKIAKEFGWQVYGAEPVKSACDYAKREFGIDIVNAGIEEARFDDNSFDVVTMWNVLDHLPNPLNTLNEIKRILKPQGILVVRVPNVGFHLFAHKLFSLFPKNINFKDPSVIVNYGFSAGTIKKMLERAGFNKIKISSSPVTSGDPYSSFKWFGDCMVSIIKNTHYLLSQLIYYLTFTKVNLGSSLLILTYPYKFK